MLIRENVPLAPLTTLQVGGPARYFAEATSAQDVIEAVNYASTRTLPFFVLGGGSNLVIADSGWPGLVLKVAIPGIDSGSESGRRVFEVGAGETWDDFVSTAVAQDCAGVECLSGIPGSVGGTPVQNVGAYGQEVSETIDSVLALDLRDRQVRELCAEACGFAYRSSIFNTTQRGRHIILRVTFALTPGGAPRIAYADLQKHFAGQSTPTLAQTREAVRAIRLSKAMLIVPGDDDCRSAGSFFKNPVLSAAQFAEVTARAAENNLAIPSYPAAGQARKISAAWLVEHSGFRKGWGTGAAGISRKHALAIVNRGSATAADIVALKDGIQSQVHRQWGILLEPEPVLVGF
jgi:UDP-N-acetylmuramate dehydrogenase